MQGNPDSRNRKIFPAESGIPLPERLESRTWNLESTAWDPEFKTVLDSLTWGDKERCYYL